MLNRIIALTSLIILMPIFLLGILGILISDWGPIFYKAKRAGKNGTILYVLKFRSMKINNKSSSKITSAADPRIFSFGKFIRLLKIDELPQLINILKGEMDIIGPRPEDLEIVEKYYDQVMMESLVVNPGLASPGSIYNYTHVESILNHNNAEEHYIKEILPLKVRMDVIYVREKSFWYQLKIVIKTIKVIFQKFIGIKKFKLPIEYYKAYDLLENEKKLNAKQ